MSFSGTIHLLSSLYSTEYNRGPAARDPPRANKSCITVLLCYNCMLFNQVHMEFKLLSKVLGKDLFKKTTLYCKS